MADMDECRAKLPIWNLFGALGLQGADKVGAWGGGGGEAKICSPFREDNSPSFSVFSRDGVGLWKDHGTGEGGDEIKLIEAARGIPTKEAMQLYCELAGVPWETGGKTSSPSKPWKPAKEAPPVLPKKSLADRLEGVEVPKKQKPKSTGFGEIVREYDYQDEKGKLLHQTLRMEPKSFRQRRPANQDDDQATVRGGFVWSLKDSRVVPYHLPELLAAPKCEPIFLVEGEKDVENLEALSTDGLEVVATCLPMGAGKWRDEFGEFFRGRWVVVIPDFDKPGLEGADLVAREIFKVADRVGVLHLESLSKQARPGWDVSDWLEGEWEIGITIEEQYRKLMDQAELAGVEELDLFSDCIVLRNNGGMSVDQDLLARLLVKIENLIYCGDSFWQWNPSIGIWEKRREKTWIERQVRRRICACGGGSIITSALVASVVRLAMSERVFFPEALNSQKSGMFPVRNGLLDVAAGKLLPHRAGHLTTVQTPHRFEPGAECPEWLAWLEERQEDQETRDQIQEIFGYCLATHINYHSFFFFYGDGGTGKSTCVDVLEWLVGEDNKVAVELTELDNAFMRSQLVGKSLALCKELTRHSLKHIGLIKAIVSGDPVAVDVKYGQGYDFRPKCRVVMESNVLPMSADSSAGFERRFIQVNFDKPIDRDGIEFNFQEKFRAEMSGILNWALVGYRRLKERGRFIHTERSKQATDDFKKHRAQVETFLKSGILKEYPHKEDNGEITRLCVWMEDVFSAYHEWCAQEDVVPFYKEKSPFARELFTKKPDWRVRKKRERVNDEIRDSRLYGIQIMENLVAT